MKKRNEPTTGLLLCQCASPEHSVQFMYWEDDKHDDPAVYLSVHLKKLRFWKRLKYATKYLFGYKCKYGAFDEIILNPSDKEKLEKILQYLTP